MVAHCKQSLCGCRHDGPPQAKLAEAVDNSVVSRQMANCAAVHATSKSITVLYLGFSMVIPEIGWTSILASACVTSGWSSRLRKPEMYRLVSTSQVHLAI